MQDDPSYVREAFAAGAQRLRAQGGGGRGARRGGPRGRRRRRYVHRSLGARLAAAEAEAEAREAADPLSEREREVLRLLALGHTNQEIAKMLFISVRTAETHRAHIMQSSGSRPAPSSSATRSAGLLEEDEEGE